MNVPVIAILPDPNCESGYTESQIADIMGNDIDDFLTWMRGQTMSICEGRRYNHNTQSYETSCGGVAHGFIVYRTDVERYIQRLPIID